MPGFESLSMSYDPSQPPNPYATPMGGGYVAPMQQQGPDLSLIFGIIATVLGVTAVVMACCPCIGLIPGGLSITVGIIALVVPAHEGSIGKILGIAGIVLGLVPFGWMAISFAMALANPH